MDTTKFSEQVILCPMCLGVGFVKYSRSMSFDEPHRLTCNYCNGKGRVMEEVFHTHINFGE
jgi:DnaJ-class molecular chaperone